VLVLFRGSSAALAIRRRPVNILDRPRQVNINNGSEAVPRPIPPLLAARLRFN
jgi:hypothetical protein